MGYLISETCEERERIVAESLGNLNGYCNGHSTLFDGVPWLEEEFGTRDMCVLEAPDEAGIYIAVLDLDMLRTHRNNDVMGDKYREPGNYYI